ncbi:MAG: hypothetical protein JWN68_3837 [Nocardioides sp.]|nr:hypothetical protein [Nocardioides sp.]
MEPVVTVELMCLPLPALVRPLLVGAVVAALAGCSGDSATEKGDAAAYDNADVVAGMTDAAAEQDSVRLTLGTKQSPDDIAIDTTWGSEPAFRALTGGDPAQQIDVRRVGDRVYLGGELVGHQWTYLDIDDPRLADPESGFDAGPVPTLLDIDVVGDLEALESAVTEAEAEGREEIDGVGSERYTLTVDSQAWFDGLGEDSMYRAMDLPETVTMDLYVDDDSLPVRLAYEVPGQDGASAQIGFSTWGTPVEVTEPARAKPVS